MVRINFIGYTMLVSDEFEWQLIITGTNGQSGHISLRVTQTGIDGGHRDWPDNNNGVSQICYFPYGELKEEDAASALRWSLKSAGVSEDLDWIVSEFEKYFIKCEYQGGDLELTKK